MEVGKRTGRAASRAAAVLLVCAATIVTGASAHAGATRWSWPLDAPHVVAGPFIAPETPYSAGHRGIDIAGAPGQRVLAPADGITHFSGWVVDRPVVSLRHPGGLISSFEPVSNALTAGEPVVAGQVIGVLEAGHCADACLHFGVRRFGEYVSPLLFLGGIPRSVLLPTRSID